MYLLKDQQRVAKDNFDSTIFLEGRAGTGKTLAGIERAKQLIRNGANADSILVLVPQSALALPYTEALRRSRVNGQVQTATLGGIAYEVVDLFWPLVAAEFEFGYPNQRPHFLSLELVQYYMTKSVGTEIERRDLFNSVTISRNRLYTQIVDNLNKAALVGFPHDRIALRLKSAWRGAVEQEYIYDDAQESATIFRELCREDNLLDFSLQVTLFTQFLWSQPPVRKYLTERYRHLIVDNIEEDTPATHDLLREWLPMLESALLIYDTDAGYRRFLGADPVSAQSLKAACAVQIDLSRQRVMSDEVAALHDQIQLSLQPEATIKASEADARAAIVYADNRYNPQMIDWAAEGIAALVHNEGVSPSEIVVLAPYLPDALRFSLTTRLDEHEIPYRTHRPSRALREEPASRTLLTLAKLAHPQWEITTSKFDVAYALTASIAELDLIRARLLTDILYRNGALQPFDQITDATAQERITFELGNRYQSVQSWMATYIEAQDTLPLDAFLSKLFGELLSQPHFGFHDAPDAANTAARLIESARNFRQTVSKIEPELDTSPEYVRMVDAGVIANQYLNDWQTEKRESVLIAPAYTFLLSNLPVDYQFWLNVGSSGWSQRLYQPLTQPYVMSRQWPIGREWTDNDDEMVNRETLTNLTLGLIRRCRKKIYLGFSEYGEAGYEQRGPLLMAVQRMLRRLQKEDEHVQTTS